MSADIVNLKRFKKSKARAEEAKIAEVNRALFGRSKAEKQKTDAVQTLETKRLDGHKLED